jgi:hypothetical protein
MAIYGRTITPADKDQFGRTVDGTIHTAEFCGRSFVKRNGCVFAPLRPERIESIPFFREQNFIPDDVMFPELCDGALREWFHHGKDIFDQKKLTYDRELIRQQLRPTRVTYANQLELWAGRH